LLAGRAAKGGIQILRHVANGVLHTEIIGTVGTARKHLARQAFPKRRTLPLKDSWAKIEKKEPLHGADARSSLAWAAIASCKAD
jgi:hypothetical protein